MNDLRPIFRCERCGHWEPRIGGETAPTCPYCPMYSRKVRRPDYIGYYGIRHELPMVPAVRAEPVLVP